MAINFPSNREEIGLGSGPLQPGDIWINNKVQYMWIVSPDGTGAWSARGVNINPLNYINKNETFSGEVGGTFNSGLDVSDALTAQSAINAVFADKVSKELTLNFTNAEGQTSTITYDGSSAQTITFADTDIANQQIDVTEGHGININSQNVISVSNDVALAGYAGARDANTSSRYIIEYDPASGNKSYLRSSLADVALDANSLGGIPASQFVTKDFAVGLNSNIASDINLQSVLNAQQSLPVKGKYADIFLEGVDGDVNSQLRLFTKSVDDPVFGRTPASFEIRQTTTINDDQKIGGRSLFTSDGQFYLTNPAGPRIQLRSRRNIDAYAYGKFTIALQPPDVTPGVNVRIPWKPDEVKVDDGITHIYAGAFSLYDYYIDRQRQWRLEPFDDITESSVEVKSGPNNLAKLDRLGYLSLCASSDYLPDGPYINFSGESTFPAERQGSIQWVRSDRSLILRSPGGVYVEDNNGRFRIEESSGNGGGGGGGSDYFGSGINNIWDEVTNPNRVSDWTDIINNALDKGGDWYFPALDDKGGYKCSGMLISRLNGTKLIGPDGARALINFDFTCPDSESIQFTDQGRLITVTSNHPCGLWCAGKTRIKNMSFQFPKSQIKNNLEKNASLVLFQKANFSREDGVIKNAYDDMDSSIDNCNFTNCRIDPGADGGDGAACITYYGRNMRVQGCTFSSGSGEGDMRAIALSYAKDANDPSEGQTYATGGHRKNMVLNNTFHMTKSSYCLTLFKGDGVDEANKNRMLVGLLINGNMNDVGGSLLEIRGGAGAKYATISGNSCIRGHERPYIHVKNGARFQNSTITGNVFSSFPAKSNNHRAAGVTVADGATTAMLTITSNTFGANITDGACISLNGTNGAVITNNIFDIEENGQQERAIRVSGGKGIITNNLHRGWEGVKDKVFVEQNGGKWDISNNKGID